MSLPGEFRIHYWRDKLKREVGFVVPTGRESVDAYECKWNPEHFESRGLAAFRANYPKGRNFLVAPIVGGPYERRFGELTLTILHPASLRAISFRLK